MSATIHNFPAPPKTVPRKERIEQARARREENEAAEAAEKAAEREVFRAKVYPPPARRKVDADSAPEIVTAVTTSEVLQDNTSFPAGEIVAGPESVTCNALTALESLTDEELISKAENAIRKVERIARDEWMPTISEMRRRFDAGHDVGGFKGIEEFYRHIGVKAGTVRQWFKRERDAAKQLPAPADVQPEPQTITKGTIDTEPVIDPFEHLKSLLTVIDTKFHVQAIRATARQTREHRDEYKKKLYMIRRFLNLRSKELNTLRDSLGTVLREENDSDTPEATEMFEKYVDEQIAAGMTP